MGPSDVVIVGAGITGLLLARLLAESGRTVTVLDKSTRPGGRLASRPMAGVLVETGPQFSRLPNSRGLASLRQYTEIGSASHVASALAEGVRVQTALVTHLTERGPVKWGCTVEDGRDVVLTAPVPQAIGILMRSGLVVPSELHGVEYERRFVLLVHSNAVDTEGQSDIFSEITAMSNGVVRADVSQEYCARRWDQDATWTESELLMEWKRIAPNARVHSFAVKRWRYANVVQAVQAPFARLPGRHIWLAGDGFGEGVVGVDRAVESAVALAGELR